MGMAFTGMAFSVLILHWKWGEMLQLFYSWNIRNPYVLLLSMLCIIALITALFIWISGWMERFFKLVFLNWVNKLAGMFLAMMAGIIVLSILIVVGTHVPRDTPLISRNRLQNSVISQLVFSVEQHTPLRRLVLKNFDQIKERVADTSPNQQEN